MIDLRIGRDPREQERHQGHVETVGCQEFLQLQPDKQEKLLITEAIAQ